MRIGMNRAARSLFALTASAALGFCAMAQEKKAAKGNRLQKIQGISGATDLRAKMNVGKNERVECSLHAPIIVQVLSAPDEFPENSAAGINSRNAGKQPIQVLGCGRIDSFTRSVPRSTVSSTASPGTASVKRRCRSSTPKTGRDPKRRITSRSRSSAV